MNTEQIVAELKRKQDEADLHANKHSMLSSYHNERKRYWDEIGDSLETAIEALSSGAFDEPLETPMEIYDSIPVDVEDLDVPSSTINEEKDPRDMKRTEFQKLGYIKIAEKLLEGHPAGKRLDMMVLEAFDVQSKEDLDRAKASFAVELNRGVRENRLRKDPDSDTYYFPASENKSTEEFNVDKSLEGIRRKALRVAPQHIEHPFL